MRSESLRAPFTEWLAQLPQPWPFPEPERFAAIDGRLLATPPQWRAGIMLDENVSRALLTDFGLARTNDDASLTRSGVHLGTPNYMSPEQVRNEAIDQRSDLFSFGCVLYTLCTGRPPFRAEQAFAVMRRITDEAPRPIRETNPNIPEWLERIVLRLMSKQVEDPAQLLASITSP